MMDINNSGGVPNLTSRVIISSLTGYAREHWHLKYLTMLKAYIDDSKSNVGDREYVLAGYIAHCEKWAEFIDSWSFVLSKAPSIKYLHAVDAQACNGEFGGWDREKSDGKLLDLASVIKFYQPLSFSVSLKQKDFDEYFAKVSPYNTKDPYFICFWAVVINLAKFVKDQGEKTSISFIFDEHGEIGNRAVQWFYFIKKSLDQDIQKVLKTTPIFENDKTIAPLQAADALAWHIRRSKENRNEHLPAKDDFLGDYHLPIEIDAEILKKLAEKMNYVHGIRHVQTKKQWRKIKKSINESIASGREPDHPKLSLFAKIKNYIISYIRFKTLARKNKPNP